MRSRTFFDRALLRKNLARFWPLWGVYFLVWAIPLPLLMAYRFLGHGYYAGESDLAYYLDNHVLGCSSEAAVIILFIFSAFAAMAVFSYLYTQKSAVFYHSLPLNRTALFFTSYLSGLGFLLLPNLAVFVLTLLVEALAGHVGFAALLVWLGSASACAFFFYSFAVFCAVFIGQLLALPIFYGILSFLVPGLEWLVRLALEEFVYGFPGNSYDLSLTVFSPAIQLINELSVRYDWVNNVRTDVWHFGGWQWLLLYAAVAAVLTALAFWVYRSRRVESAGDLVSVRAVRPVFKYGVALCAALTLGRWLYEIFSFSATVWLLLAFMCLGGFLGYFAAEMLLRKSFRVFRRGIRGFLIFALALIVFAAAMEYDLFGYEKRVPDAEGVSAVYVKDGYFSRYSPDTVPGLTSAEDIGAVLALHRSLTEHKADIEAQLGSLYSQPAAAESVSLNDPVALYFPSYTTEQVSIRYLLTNGRELSRTYTVPVTRNLLEDPESPAAQLQALLKHPALLRAELCSGDPCTFTFRGGSFQLYSGGLDYTYLTLDAAQAKQVFQAALRDAEAGNIQWTGLLYDAESLREYYVNELTLDYVVPGDDGKMTNYTISVQLRADSAETLSVLREAGVPEGEGGLLTALQERVLNVRYRNADLYG